jgi:UTP-glucose-1-phosphate uridylyltransferase
MLRTKATLLVLAAGMGSRYGSLKQVDKLGPSGETIMDYSIYDAIRSGFGKVVFVIRKNIEADFKEIFSKYSNKIKIEYVFQELDNIPAGINVPAERQKPWGTGHAVLVAASAIDTPFAVINADDFYGSRSYHAIAEHLTTRHDSDKSTYSMVGYILENSLSEFGYVSRGICETNQNHLLKSITERTQIQKKDNQIVFKETDESWKPLSGKEIVSMNFWGFPPSIFSHLQRKFKSFIEVNYQNPKAEFYLPIAVNDLISEGIADVKVLSTPDKWFGITYKEDKQSSIQKINELVKEGVYPANLWKS